MADNKQVMEYIDWFWKTNHHSPAIRDLADYFRTSTSVINYYLMRLEDYGLIEKRGKGKSRTIIPVHLGQAIAEYYESQITD